MEKGWKQTLIVYIFSIIVIEHFVCVKLHNLHKTLWGRNNLPKSQTRTRIWADIVHFHCLRFQPLSRPLSQWLSLKSWGEEPRYEKQKRVGVSGGDWQMPLSRAAAHGRLSCGSVLGCWACGKGSSAVGTIFWEVESNSCYDKYYISSSMEALRLVLGTQDASTALCWRNSQFFPKEKKTENLTVYLWVISSPFWAVLPLDAFLLCLHQGLVPSS